MRPDAGAVRVQLLGGQSVGSGAPAAVRRRRGARGEQAARHRRGGTGEARLGAEGVDAARPAFKILAR